MMPEPASPDRVASRRVRPYLLTGGRTEAAGVPADATVVQVRGAVVADEPLIGERRALVEHCATPQSLTALQRALCLPLGVIRVLAGELIAAGLLRVVGDDGASEELAAFERRLSKARQVSAREGLPRPRS